MASVEYARCQQFGSERGKHLAYSVQWEERVRTSRGDISWLLDGGRDERDVSGRPGCCMC